MKQIKLFSEKVVKEFGGNVSTSTGKRKVARPLVFSKPMHLVLKTSKAKGKYAFSPTDYRLKNLIQKMAARFGVKVYSVAQSWNGFFFDRKPYTKVASWGKQFRNLKTYALKNELQALKLPFEVNSKATDQLIYTHLR